MTLSGVIVPVITPLDEQFELNPSALCQLIERLVASGVDGVMVAGTTAEA